MIPTDLTGFELSSLPTAEDDEYEFKSSATPQNELKKKMACAVSGFGNSGGGCFVAGVDGQGDADGGLLDKVGKQDLRDWADQVVHLVEPTPLYDIALVGDARGRGKVESGKCVLVVAIRESAVGPHMAPDNRYYIRAGAHTVAARHFIVDAIWAKRHAAKPRISHVFRLKPEYQAAIQLGIVALTPAPALDVVIEMGPFADLLREEHFPLRIPVIDGANPFFFDVTTMYEADERFGKDMQLRVSYKDLAGKSYSYEAPLDITRAIPPISIGGDAGQRIAKSLEEIAKAIRR